MCHPPTRLWRGLSAAWMSGVDGMQREAEEIDCGARLTATEADAALIHGLGFIGLMTVGMHHQAHHLGTAPRKRLHQR
jgi:hypothetical protein